MQRLKEYRNVFLSHITVQVRCLILVTNSHAILQELGLYPLTAHGFQRCPALCPPGPQEGGRSCVGDTPTSQKPHLTFCWGERDTLRSGAERHQPWLGHCTVTILPLGLLTDSKLSLPISVLFHCPRPRPLQPPRSNLQRS